MNRLWGVIAAVLAALAACPDGAAAQTKTHGMALDSVATMVAGDLLREPPVPPGRPVLLVTPIRGDTLGLLTQRILERLRAQRIPVRMGPGAAAPDSAAEAATDAEAYAMNVRVDGAGVAYTRRIRSFPFGVKGYERLVAMRAGATLVAPSTGEVVWARSASARLTDVVPKRDVAAAASGSGGINPPLPSGSGFRLLEPLIVLGVVSGLVVLFYSNRT